MSHLFLVRLRRYLDMGSRAPAIGAVNAEYDLRNVVAMRRSPVRSWPFRQFAVLVLVPRHSSDFS